MPKTTAHKLVGTLILNAQTMQNLTACEITPAGNGEYAVTVRQVLKDQAPTMFQETYQGKVHIIYTHSALKDVRLEGNFLDFGIQDEDGELLLSLYFRARQEKPVIATIPAPSIVLAK
jgi:hypothetical protein